MNRICPSPKLLSPNESKHTMDSTQSVVSSSTTTTETHQSLGPIHSDKFQATLDSSSTDAKTNLPLTDITQMKNNDSKDFDDEIRQIETKKKNLKTEYKSNFTPFDQYVYNEVTDSFVKAQTLKEGASNKNNLTVERHSEKVSSNQDLSGTFESLGSPALEAGSFKPVQKGEHRHNVNEPWYKEVVKRNEKANEYRFKSEVGHNSPLLKVSQENLTRSSPCGNDPLTDAQIRDHQQAQEQGSSSIGVTKQSIRFSPNDYKRDHLIAYMANNNNFNLAKDSETQSGHSAAGAKSTQSRRAQAPGNRLSSHVRARSQSSKQPSTAGSSTIRAESKSNQTTPTKTALNRNAATTSRTGTISTTTTRPKATTTTAPAPAAPKSQRPTTVTSTTSRVASSRPTTASATRRTPATSAGVGLRPSATSTIATSRTTINSVRPSTATSSSANKMPSASSRPITSSRPTATRPSATKTSTASRASASASTTTKSTSSTSRSGIVASRQIGSTANSKTSSSPRGSTASQNSTTSPANEVKSIKTPKAIASANAKAAAAAAAAAALTTAAVVSSTTDPEASQITTETFQLDSKESTLSSRTAQQDLVAIKQEPIEIQHTFVEPEGQNFIFPTTEAGNMLADEIAQAEKAAKEQSTNDGLIGSNDLVNGLAGGLVSAEDRFDSSEREPSFGHNEDFSAEREVLPEKEALIESDPRNIDDEPYSIIPTAYSESEKTHLDQQLAHLDEQDNLGDQSSDAPIFSHDTIIDKSNGQLIDPVTEQIQDDDRFKTITLDTSDTHNQQIVDIEHSTHQPGVQHEHHQIEPTLRDQQGEMTDYQIEQDNIRDQQDLEEFRSKFSDDGDEKTSQSSSIDKEVITSDANQGTLEPLKETHDLQTEAFGINKEGAFVDDVTTKIMDGDEPTNLPKTVHFSEEPLMHHDEQSVDHVLTQKLDDVDTKRSEHDISFNPQNQDETEKLLFELDQTQNIREFNADGIVTPDQVVDDIHIEASEAQTTDSKYQIVDSGDLHDSDVKSTEVGPLDLDSQVASDSSSVHANEFIDQYKSEQTSETADCKTNNQTEAQASDKQVSADVDDQSKEEYHEVGTSDLHKNELLMNVADLIDVEAQKKQEMARKSELAKQQSNSFSPMTSANASEIASGEILLAVDQLDDQFATSSNNEAMLEHRNSPYQQQQTELEPTVPCTNEQLQIDQQDDGSHNLLPPQEHDTSSEINKDVVPHSQNTLVDERNLNTKETDQVNIIEEHNTESSSHDEQNEKTSFNVFGTNTEVIEPNRIDEPFGNDLTPEEDKREIENSNIVINSSDDTVLTPSEDQEPIEKTQVSEADQLLDSTSKLTSTIDDKLDDVFKREESNLNFVNPSTVFETSTQQIVMDRYETIPDDMDNDEHLKLSNHLTNSDDELILDPRASAAVAATTTPAHVDPEFSPHRTATASRYNEGAGLPIMAHEDRVEADSAELADGSSAEIVTPTVAEERIEISTSKAIISDLSQAATFMHVSKIVHEDESDDDDSFVLKPDADPIDVAATMSPSSSIAEEMIRSGMGETMTLSPAHDSAKTQEQFGVDDLGQGESNNNRHIKEANFNQSNPLEPSEAKETL